MTGPLTRLSLTLGVLVALIGAVVLLGWSLDLEHLKSGVPGLVAMNPATAIGFILGGIALYAGRNQPVIGRRRSTVLFGGWALVFLGASVLFRYLMGWETGLDQLLFHDQLIPRGTGLLNRMAPNTALMFSLTGISLLVLDDPRRTIRRVGEGLSLVVLILAFFALAGYLYQASFLYGVASYIPMALNTALAFGALTTGIMASRADRGFVQLLLSRSPGGVLARHILPPTILLPLLIGYLRLYGERLELYDAGGGVALLVTLTTVSLTGLVWWSAASVDRADDVRRGAEEEVRASKERLEERVIERTRDLAGSNEQLRRTADELEALVQAAPVAIVSIDPAGKVLSWYGGAEKMFGWSAAEAVGRPLANVPPEKEAEFMALRARVLHDDSVIGLETYRSRKDGSKIDVNVSYAPLHDRTGKAIGATIVYQDITERRLVTEQRQAREAAEAANRAKSNFLANMSHELRTPLNAIIGFSELLEDQTFGPLNEKQQRYVTNVHSSGRHLLQLVNDILDLAKVEAGRLVLDPETINLTALLHDMQRGLEPLAVAKRQTLSVELPDDLPSLIADRSKVKQILYNLFSNAIKFTPEGGRLGLRAKVTHPENGSAQLELAVWDRGIGIAQQDLDRIFLEFEQLDSTYVRQQEGTGLGLALTLRLVEAHGGRILVESAMGQGSTFTVLFPVSQPVTQAGPERLEVRTPGPDGERPLVLVVEDDTTGRELLSHYLLENGYAVAYAGTGRDAIALAKQLRPAAISLDILLPDMHGLQVLSDLRAHPDTQNTPVIIVSITDDRDRGLSAGAAAWLVKPVKRQEFIEALDRVMPGAIPGDNKLALVVDDDAEAVELAADILAQRGFEVLRAFGGSEGLTLAFERLPGLIILDLSMPGMSGFTVAQQLRANPRTRHTPIVVSTALDLSAVEREDLLRHVQTIVPKRGAEGILEALQRLGLRPGRAAETNGRPHQQAGSR